MSADVVSIWRKGMVIGMTIFYFVRHGEPDYSSVGEWAAIPFGKEFAGLTEQGIIQITKAAAELKVYRPQIILSSPYTRTMQGAGIMAQELQIPILVERDMHEWEVDRTHTVREESELLRLCQDYDFHNGIYPEGAEKQWESRQVVRDRVLGVLEKYLAYDRVVVSGHAIMMQDVSGQYKPFAYGEILQKTWDEIR